MSRIKVRPIKSQPVIVRVYGVGSTGARHENTLSELIDLKVKAIMGQLGGKRLA